MDCFLAKMLFHRLNLLNKIQLHIEKQKGIFPWHSRLNNFKEMILQMKSEDRRDVAKNAINHLGFAVLHCLSPWFLKIKLTGFLAQGFDCQSHVPKSLFYVYPKNVHQ